MSLSLQRLWGIPRRMARTLINANQYHSRMFLSAEASPTTTSQSDPMDNDDNNDNNLPSSEDNNNTDATEFKETTQEDYSHYLSEKPLGEFGRKMRIYMPARSAGTQGVAKVGMWKVEPMNPGKRWGNPLMGWTSTRDPMQSINTGLERFATKEHAIEWCASNGYEYEVFEPKLPRRKPKNYASTMGRNGPPITTNIQGGDTGSSNE